MGSLLSSGNTALSDYLKIAFFPPFNFVFVLEYQPSQQCCDNFRRTSEGTQHYVHVSLPPQSPLHQAAA